MACSTNTKIAGWNCEMIWITFSKCIYYDCGRQSFKASAMWFFIRVFFPFNIIRLWLYCLRWGSFHQTWFYMYFVWNMSVGSDSGESVRHKRLIWHRRVAFDLHARTFEWRVLLMKLMLFGWSVRRVRWLAVNESIYDGFMNDYDEQGEYGFYILIS